MKRRHQTFKCALGQWGKLGERGTKFQSQCNRWRAPARIADNVHDVTCPACLERLAKSAVECLAPSRSHVKVVATPEELKEGRLSVQLLWDGKTEPHIL